MKNFLLDCRGKILDCRPGQEHGAHVMGVLNITPDSFSDGGNYMRRDDALRRVERMLSEGATLIDVGGESSRPQGAVYGEGAEVVSPEEELRRVLPVVEAVRQKFPEVILSVDTYKPRVAEEVLAAGAHMINDITGLRNSEKLAPVVAHFGASLVVMHAVGSPGAWVHEKGHSDIRQVVKTSLRRSRDVAWQAGVSHVVVDPGFGFGKTARENLQLVNHLDQLLPLKCPILVGISRKSTIGIMLSRDGVPAPVQERLFGTLGATAVAVMRGASIVRTNDNRRTVELLRGIGALMGVTSY